MPNSRESLLSEIKPGCLDENFIKKIYCDEITHPGFSEIALEKLEEVGIFDARSRYKQFVDAYEAREEAILKDVATWYSNELKKRRQYIPICRTQNQPAQEETRRELLQRKRELLQKKMNLLQSMQNLRA